MKLRWEELLPAKEIWRSIPAFPNYEVSSNGQFRNVVTGKLLAPVLYRGSYYATPYHKSRKLKRTVGNWVLRAFVGPPPTGMQCRHGPKGRAVHTLDNLCWGTSKEDWADKRRDGTATIGMRHGRAKLAEHQVRRIRLLFRQGQDKHRLAQRFQVTQPNISAIVNRKTWKHVA